MWVAMSQVGEDDVLVYSLAVSRSEPPIQRRASQRRSDRWPQAARQRHLRLARYRTRSATYSSPADSATRFRIPTIPPETPNLFRSEERRVGKEWRDPRPPTH